MCCARQKISTPRSTTFSKTQCERAWCRTGKCIPGYGGDRRQIPTLRRRAARHNKSRSPGRIRPGQLANQTQADECIRHHAFGSGTDKRQVHGIEKKDYSDIVERLVSD